MSITASRHGTPTTLAGSRCVAEEQAASWIPAETKTRCRALRQNFSSGTRDGCEKPVERIFSRNEFQPPRVRIGNQFVMALGNTENLVDGPDPLARYPAAPNRGGKNLAQSCLQPLGTGEQSLGGPAVKVGKSQELRPALRRNHRGGFEKSDQALPGERTRAGAGEDLAKVHKIHGKPAAERSSFIERSGHSQGT